MKQKSLDSRWGWLGCQTMSWCWCNVRWYAWPGLSYLFMRMEPLFVMLSSGLIEWIRLCGVWSSDAVCWLWEEVRLDCRRPHCRQKAVPSISSIFQRPHRFRRYRTSCSVMHKRHMQIIESRDSYTRLAAPVYFLSWLRPVEVKT